MCSTCGVSDRIECRLYIRARVIILIALLNYYHTLCVLYIFGSPSRPEWYVKLFYYDDNRTRVVFTNSRGPGRPYDLVQPL